MFATVVISILLAAVVAAVIWNLRSKKKRGKSCLVEKGDFWRKDVDNVDNSVYK